MRKITLSSKFNKFHVTMIRAVIGFALDASNLVITSSIQAWLDFIDALQANLAQIDILMQEKALSLKGYAQQKKDYKAALVESTLRIMNAVYNYALNIGDTVLQEAMLINKSDLERMTYENIVPKAQAAIAIVTPLVLLLVNYDVTSKDVKDWQADTTALNDVLTKVKNAYSSRKSMNKAIQDLLRQCMTMLYNQGDTFITSFKKNNLKYYNDYWANRKLMRTGIHHTGLDASIQNPLGFPIVNALVTIDSFVKNKKTYKAVSLLTDINGFAPLREFEPGMRTVTVSGTGIITQTFPAYEFEKGRIIKAILTVMPGIKVVIKETQKKLVKK